MLSVTGGVVRGCFVASEIGCEMKRNLGIEELGICTPHCCGYSDFRGLVPFFLISHLYHRDILKLEKSRLSPELA